MSHISPHYGTTALVGLQHRAPKYGPLPSDTVVDWGRSLSTSNTLPLPLSRCRLYKCIWHDIKEDERSLYPVGSSPALGKEHPDLGRWRDTEESALSGLPEPFSFLSFPQSQQLADLTPTCLLPTQTMQTTLCIFTSSSTSSQGPVLVSKTSHKPLRFFPLPPISEFCHLHCHPGQWYPT